MNCNQCQMLIFDQVDGTLNRRQMALVAAHLEQCGHCRDYLEDEQAMRRIFSAVLADRENELTLSPAVRRNVISAVKPARERTRPWLGIPRLVWALAAVLMLAVIQLSLYRAVGVRQEKFAGNRSVTKLESFNMMTQETEEARLTSDHLLYRPGLHDGNGGLFYPPMCTEDVNDRVEIPCWDDDWSGEIHDDEIKREDNPDSEEFTRIMRLASMQYPPTTHRSGA